MQLRRLAFLALLAVVSCHDTPTEPAVPAEPAIHIDSPVSGETIGDTIVLLRGVAEAPGSVDWVEVGYDYQNQTGNSINFYRYDEHFNPDGSIQSTTRVPFEAQLHMRAGTKQVVVTMWYRTNRDDPISAST